MFKKITDSVNWKIILKKFPAYDFYHTWDYHQLATSKEDGEPVLFFHTENENLYCIPLIERTIQGTNLIDYSSIYGYTGPLSTGNSEWTKKVWEKFTAYLFELHAASLFTRINTLTCPKSILPEEPIGITVFIDLTKPDEEQIEKYSKSLKRDLKNIRKLGFDCIETKDKKYIPDFMSIYDDTMKKIGASDYYKFDYTYYEKFISSQDFDGRICFCFDKGKPIAASLFAYCGDIVQYHLSGTLEAYYKMMPSKFILEYVRKSATAENRKYLHLGGGVGAKNDSLLSFKKSFSENTLNYYVIKKIIDENIYNNLSEKQVSKIYSTGKIPNLTYFPLYRTQ